MPGTTPNQVYSYPLSTDRPCDLPALLQSVATAVDSKFQGYDTDAARLAKRKYAKISRTSFSYGQNGNDNAGDVAFDTIEANNGTATDLTVDAFNLRIPAGYWVLSGKVAIPSSSSGQLFSISFGFYDSNISSKMTRANSCTRDYGSGFTTLAIQDILYAASADGNVRVCLTFSQENAATATISYASLSAWWISDV